MISCLCCVRSAYWPAKLKTTAESEQKQDVSLTRWEYLLGLTGAADPEPLGAAARAGAPLGRALHRREASPVPVRPGARVVLQMVMQPPSD